MAKVYFFEFTNKTPHIETAFELARGHAEAGDKVVFHFCGHDTSFREFVYPIRVSPEIYGSWLPERKGAKHAAHPNLQFLSRVVIPKRKSEAFNFHSLRKLKQFKYKEFDLGMAVASGLISYYGQDDENILPFIKISNRMIKSSMEVYDWVLDILSKGKPDLVYLFNGRFYHPKAVMRACQTLGIPFRIHERGCNPTKYFLEPFMPHDRVRVQERTLELWQNCQDRKEAEILARGWFEKRREGADTDTKSYTSKQKRNLLPEIPIGNKVLTYYTSSNDEYSAVGDLFQWKGWNDQIEAVSELIKVSAMLDRTTLVIRLHPNLASKSERERAPWVELRKANKQVIFVDPTDPVDTYALAERSDTVVTSGSKMGIEATYWQKPSILLGPCYYDMLDVTYPAHSREDLMTLLPRSLDCKFSENVLAYGLWWATFGRPHRLYRSLSYQHGLFMGNDLQEMPGFVKYTEALYYGAKKTLLKLVKK